MKEIRLMFYTGTRKNAKCKYKSYAIYNGYKNGKSAYTKNDLYDAVDYICSLGYTGDSKHHYISVAATDYNSAALFNSNDFSKNNMLDLPETRRYNVDFITERIELFKLVYYYMILLGAEFDYSYNPFKDSNIIFHTGEIF